jgi:3',5'-cyclic-AMP phosphodiesterase
VRARAWDAQGVVSAACRIDDEPWRPMSQVGTSLMWSCTWNTSEAEDGSHDITVHARCADGRTGDDTISVLTSQSGGHQARLRKPGDNANAIGAYPLKGILGTQLGPNKNGRKW